MCKLCGDDYCGNSTRCDENCNLVPSLRRVLKRGNKTHGHSIIVSPGDHIVNGNFQSTGDCVTTIAGVCKATVGSDRLENIGGDRKIAVAGDSSLSTGGSRTVNVEGNSALTINAEALFTVNGGHTANIGNRSLLNVGGDRAVSVVGAQTIDIGNRSLINVGGDQAVSVVGAQTTSIGGVQTTNINNKSLLNVGGDRAVSVVGAQSFNTGGTFSVTAPKIVLEGDVQIPSMAFGSVTLSYSTPSAVNGGNTVASSTWTNLHAANTSDATGSTSWFDGTYITQPGVYTVEGFATLYSSAKDIATTVVRFNGSTSTTSLVRPLQSANVYDSAIVPINGVITVPADASPSNPFVFNLQYITTVGQVNGLGKASLLPSINNVYWLLTMIRMNQ